MYQIFFFFFLCLFLLFLPLRNTPPFFWFLTPRDLQLSSFLQYLSPHLVIIDFDVYSVCSMPTSSNLLFVFQVVITGTVHLSQTPHHSFFGINLSKILSYSPLLHLRSSCLLKKVFNITFLITIFM